MNIIVQKYKSLQQIIYEKRFIPDSLRHDDVYIVEFPKSGISWFSTILANWLALVNNSSIQINWYNIQQIIPDIHMSKDIGPPFFSYPGYRFIKSHSKYNRKYQHIIYIIRNPFDVVKSYYKFLFHPNEVVDLNQFISETCSSYNEHIEGWLLNSIGSQRLHLIKYESLKEHPITVFKELLENLGINIDNNDYIAKAVASSSIEKMRQKEEKYSGYHPAYFAKFVRKFDEGYESVIDNYYDKIHTITYDYVKDFYPSFKNHRVSNKLIN